MRLLAAIFIGLALAAFACGQPAGLPTPAATITPAGDAAWLEWYQTRGEGKQDEAWGVDTDSQGNVYVAAYMQVPPDDFFFDVVVYKLTAEGEELWRRQWGGALQEKAFIVTVSEPLVLVGGLVNTA